MATRIFASDQRKVPRDVEEEQYEDGDSCNIELEIESQSILQQSRVYEVYRSHYMQYSHSSSTQQVTIDQWHLLQGKNSSNTPYSTVFRLSPFHLDTG